MSQQANQNLTKDLNVNLNILKEIYQDCLDIVFRLFKINRSINACLIYTSGLVNVEEIDKSILAPLTQQRRIRSIEIEEMITVANIKKMTTINECVTEITNGNPIILIDHNHLGYVAYLHKSEHRSIEEPMSEQLIRGPREGFIEDISINITLIRKKIKTPQLKMQEIILGTETNTKVVISYIKGIAKENLINEVKERINKIKIDGILDSHTVEELIEDNPFSPFPQVLSTERPDTICSQLLEGKVAILVDGSPFVMAVPATFFSQFQSGEDYYSWYGDATLIRWLRLIFIFIALLLPSIYVAVLSFHQEMVPTPLLLKIMSSREEIPFPIFVEVLMMEVTFEALREAGLRLPKQIGSAVSIVGALVIGESAVSAGIVSAPVVIIVALTGIASFTVPKYSISTAVRILRFPFIILAVLLGLLGVMVGLIILIVHLCTVRSFGVPLLEPVAPLNIRELKDSLIRAPWWMMDTRPGRRKNSRRQVRNQKPSPNK